MRPIVLVLCILAAACRLPAAVEAPRAPRDQLAAAVLVSVTCGDPGDGWYRSSSASGVVVSSRHVLTAHHATACPAIPAVRVTLADGQTYRAHVEEEWPGYDVSRLELSSGDSLRVPVVRPVLAAAPPDVACAIPAHPARGGSCGPLVRRTATTYRYALEATSGNSGAGVYDSDGALVGILVAVGASSGDAIVSPIRPEFDPYPSDKE